MLMRKHSTLFSWPSKIYISDSDFPDLAMLAKYKNTFSMSHTDCRLCVKSNVGEVNTAKPLLTQAGGGVSSAQGRQGAELSATSAGNTVGSQPSIRVS